MQVFPARNCVWQDFRFSLPEIAFHHSTAAIKCVGSYVLFTVNVFRTGPLGSTEATPHGSLGEEGQQFVTAHRPSTCLKIVHSYGRESTRRSRRLEARHARP